MYVGVGLGQRLSYLALLVRGLPRGIGVPPGRWGLAVGSLWGQVHWRQRPQENLIITLLFLFVSFCSVVVVVVLLFNIFLFKKYLICFFIFFYINFLVFSYSLFWFDLLKIIFVYFLYVYLFSLLSFPVLFLVCFHFKVLLFDCSYFFFFVFFCHAAILAVSWLPGKSWSQYPGGGGMQKSRIWTCREVPPTPQPREIFVHGIKRFGIILIWLHQMPVGSSAGGSCQPTKNIGTLWHCPSHQQAACEVPTKPIHPS